LTVLIDNRQESIEISEDIIELIKKTVKTVLDFEKCTVNYEISISLVNNKEIKELNRDYRNIDKDTDVLSFPMINFSEESEDYVMVGEEAIDPPLGDIVISLEKTKEQALEYGHSFERELVFLLIHGMLHLLGYDHLNIDDEEKMIDKQKKILMQLKYNL